MASAYGVWLACADRCDGKYWRKDENDAQRGTCRTRFHEDPRYKQCNREALLGLGLGLLNLICGLPGVTVSA